MEIIKLPRRARRRGKKLAPKLSPHRRPEGMGLDEWQTALRREFGR